MKYEAALRLPLALQGIARSRYVRRIETFFFCKLQQKRLVGSEMIENGKLKSNLN